MTILIKRHLQACHDHQPNIVEHYPETARAFLNATVNFFSEYGKCFKMVQQCFDMQCLSYESRRVDLLFAFEKRYFH